MQNVDAEGNLDPDFFTETPPDITSILSDGRLWSDACGQAFFSLSLCVGIMPCYSSYNSPDWPIISSGLKVSLADTLLSFLCGFAVFSTVGYLYGIESDVASNVSSIGLAYVALPAAIDTMDWANFWCFILSLTLFNLGIDSAFSQSESVITAIHDSRFGKKASKFFWTSIVCCFGAIISTMFCFNWGFTLLDIVDFYLNTYTVLLMAILQATGAAWIHCFEDAYAKSKIATIVLVTFYWLPTLILPWCSYFIFPLQSWIGLPVIWAWYIVTSYLSMILARCIDGVDFKTWYHEILFYGIRPISRHMLALAEYKYTRIQAALFDLWFCLSIKFVFPWAIYLLMVMTVQKNVEKPYGNYHFGWQMVGVLIVAIGLVLFLIPLLSCKKQKHEDEFKT